MCWLYVIYHDEQVTTRIKTFFFLIDEKKVTFQVFPFFNNTNQWVPRKVCFLRQSRFALKVRIEGSHAVSNRQFSTKYTYRIRWVLSLDLRNCAGVEVMILLWFSGCIVPSVGVTAAWNIMLISIHIQSHKLLKELATVEWCYNFSMYCSNSLSADVFHVCNFISHIQLLYYYSWDLLEVWEVSISNEF